MPEKLLTLEELSLYLGVSEDKIKELVDINVIFAYKIGGEYLRFRRSQIDAIATEINSRVEEKDRIVMSAARASVRERHRGHQSSRSDSFADKIKDFFYFYDFYFVTSGIIVALLIVIFKG
jgi:excisionase family DNA binding protein